MEVVAEASYRSLSLSHSLQLTRNSTYPEESISTSTTTKASRLLYGHICDPIKEDIHELVDTLKPSCLARVGSIACSYNIDM